MGKKKKNKGKHKKNRTIFIGSSVQPTKASKKMKKKWCGLTPIEMECLCEKIKVNKNPITIISTVKKY